MKRLRLLPYKPGSKSAKVIAQALNGLRVRMQGRFRPKRWHLVLNWGSVRKPTWWTEGLNNPEAVGRSSDKAVALSYLRQHGVTTPEFTNDANVARGWVARGDVVVGRAVLNGHGGIGCRMYSANPEHGLSGEPSGCPLYTKHVRHKREFRIHVFKGKVIDQVEKLKKRGVNERQAWIRNHDNGYVFARQVQPIPEIVRSESLKAVQALGLDFGAVDVAYREKEDKAYVLEVNTAPGVEGQTIQSYINAIRTEMGI